MTARHRPAGPLDGRTAAALAVADALAGRRFASEALRELRIAGQLAGREAGLALEIAHGALRHVVTIEHVLAVLARFDRDRTPPRVRAVLYTGAYQLIWLDRIPPFAAVDGAVDVARRLTPGRAPGMVNAVLRRVADGIAKRRVTWQRLDATQVRVSWDQACQFRGTVIPTGDESLHLAIAAGERPQRYAELVTRHGPAAAEAVAWAMQAVPATVVYRNTLRVSPAEWDGLLFSTFGDQAETVGDRASLPPSLVVIDTPAFATGQLFVQDATAHAAAAAAAAQPGESILDLCAAPGGKSIALALALEDRGEVVACDSGAERLLRVQENVARLGLTCVRTSVLKHHEPPPGPHGGGYDAVLVDAPCSNTGVIARRPEARLGLTPEKVASLVSLQGELLRTAARFVRPGGRLVYSTCSIEPVENEQLVAAFLASESQWHLDTAELTLPAWGPRWSDYRDGGYFARLIRCAS
jgi:16S rRNA (cytosine967-C5)-methyltransferase